MKMKKVVRMLGLCALVALAITSCKKNEEQSSQLTIKATINQPVAEDRTHIGDRDMLEWDADNEILVVNANGTTAPFQTSESNVVTANFTGTIARTATYTAFYPEATKVENNVKINLSDKQNYVANNFGNDTYPMYGTATDGNNIEFGFNSHAGVLRLSFYSSNPCTVGSIIVTGGTNDVLAGTIVSAYDDPANYTVEEGKNQVTLNCGNGVVLGEQDTYFNIVMLNCTFPNGFTVQVYDQQNGQGNEIISFNAPANEQNQLKAMHILNMGHKEVHYDLPTVTTDAATVSYTDATLNGHYTEVAGAEVSQCGFYWGTDQNNLTNKVTCPSASTPMSYGLTVSGDNLVPGTTYYYKAWAKNSTGEVSAVNVESFIIPVQVVAPTVTTVGHEVTGTSVKMYGRLDNDGNEACTVGIQWAENDAFTGSTVRNFAVSGTHNAVYNFDRTNGGLTYNKTYFYRAYATNSNDTRYGETKTILIDFQGNFRINDNDDRVTFASGLLYWDDAAQEFAIENDQFSYHRFLDDEPYGNVQASFGQFCHSNDFNRYGRDRIENQQGHDFSEWGENQIRKPNSTDKYPANYWRTLSYDEWQYVAQHHKKFVRDNYFILMPYDWQGTSISGLSWTQLQDLGAAIFPMVGAVVDNTGTGNPNIGFSFGSSCILWTSTVSTNTGGSNPWSSGGAIWFYTRDGGVVGEGENNAYFHRFCVRLAKDVQ